MKCSRLCTCKCFCPCDGGRNDTILVVATQKLRICVFEQPFGDLGVTYALYVAYNSLESAIHKIVNTAFLSQPLGTLKKNQFYAQKLRICIFKQPFGDLIKANVPFERTSSEEEEEEFIKPQHKNITLKRLRQ